MSLIPLTLYKDSKLQAKPVILVQVSELKIQIKDEVKKEKKNNFATRLIENLDWRHTKCNTTHYARYSKMKCTQYDNLKKNNIESITCDPKLSHT
jgi:hypothetical protein